MNLTKKLLSGIASVAIAVSALPMMVSANVDTIKLGDYVQMGKYYDQPVMWRCVAFEKVTGYDSNNNPIIDSTDTSTEFKEGYIPLMMSDKDICLKSFDVGGGVTTGSHGRGQGSGINRQKNGSNYWADSNMRSWLNSDAPSGEVVWACGNSSDKCGQSYFGASDTFAKEAGFLTNFNEIGHDAILAVTQKSIIDGYEYSAEKDENCYKFKTVIADCVQNYATASSEQTTDKVFLLDVQQINNVYKNAGKLGNDYHVGTLTKQAADNVEAKTTTLIAGKKNATWLRTPYTESNSSNVCTVGVSGDISFSAAYQQLGIRPAFFLNTAITNIGSGKGTNSDPYILTSDNVIKVTVNNENVNFDQVPLTINDRTLVPVRAIFEAMGATVIWDGETQTVSASLGINKIQLTIDSNQMKKNSETIEIDVPAQIIGDRTYVPVRAIAEAFGADVQWEDSTKTVVISTIIKK